jgi:hypothetical protein
MTNDVTPHFSRKILFLSFIFLLANLGIYGLRFLAAQPTEMIAVAPRIVSATITEIKVKSPYDETYKPAQAGQEIFVGSSVKTGEKEFAELELGQNNIRLDEMTEVKLITNNFSGTSTFAPETPRLELELVSGAIWVNAFDLIDIRSPRSTVRLQHSVAMLTYTAPLNRLMVFTGAADLSLLDSTGNLLSDFVVPLNNQVTFIDTQITKTYAALKPSKLKKELKMTPLSPEILSDEWVVRNANDFADSQKALTGELITSRLSYQIRSAYETALTYLTFTPEARRALSLEKAKTMLAYILGAVQEGGDEVEAEVMISEFKDLVIERKNDPMIESLVVKTLFGIEGVPSGTPADLLKETLIGMVAENEGPYVFGVYLTDVRRALYEKDVKTAEKAAAKWMENWKAHAAKENVGELDRQTQILNHTILAFKDIVSQPMLDTFDAGGMLALSYAADIEDARYELITNRLQIASSLISAYRYVLAKQYLKNTYLGLNIENLSPDLASTQVFLENGKLLAQRIEYAEAVLHGAAQPINETKFRDYFQIIKRDEALSADLRKFFELDTGEVTVQTQVQTPTAAQVASRFLDARINVNFADISQRNESGFYYDIKNARLMDKGQGGKTLSFDATYDYSSNSVTNVITTDKTYQGGFTLSDVVVLLKQGGVLPSGIHAPTVQEGVELLITDQEKIQAQEGQAIAQDVARQLVYNQLTAYGMTIPQVKFDIQILDLVNLNRFHVKQALIPRKDKDESVNISFDFSTVTGEVTNVVSQEGVTLFEKTTAKDLVVQVLAKILEVEKQIRAVGDFTSFVEDNDLSIAPKDIVYTEDGMIYFNNLELLSLGLKASGQYNPETKLFVTVTNPLLSGQNVKIKDYFKQLADQTVLTYMRAKGFILFIDQIQSTYPFESIVINRLNIAGTLYSFKLDMTNDKALEVRREGDSVVIDELSLEDLKAQQ